MDTMAKCLLHALAISLGLVFWTRDPLALLLQEAAFVNRHAVAAFPLLCFLRYTAICSRAPRLDLRKQGDERAAPAVRSSKSSGCASRASARTRGDARSRHPRERTRARRSRGESFAPKAFRLITTPSTVRSRIGLVRGPERGLRR